MVVENNIKRAASHIWLTRKEQQLREALDHGDMPVLGLYIDHFSAKDREYFRSTVLGSTHPVSSFLRSLEHWPATFATYLTVHLVEGYGQLGHAGVYPYIQAALGMDGNSLSPVDRERLAAAYRRACVGLGLSVAPKGDGGRAHVDEYLRQVGVPVSYFEGLFEGFSRQARRVGVPDADDPNDLAAWELFVDIPKTRPVLRRAVENDGEGYYAGLFLRVSEFLNESDCTNAIERAAYDAFKALGHSLVKRKALIPSLSWRDDQLGILLPAGDDTLWSIRIIGVDGEKTTVPQVQGGIDPRFVPVDTALPERCEVFSQELDFVFAVWESAENNQFVVFDRAGKFVTQGRLGGSSITLDPGSYTLVSRWRPPEFGESSHAVSDNDTLFSSQLELVAGQVFELSRGPANVLIAARNVPALAWEGDRLVGMTGKEIYWGGNLAVRVTIPPEIMEGAAEGFQLVVSSAGVEDRFIALSNDSESTIVVPLGVELSEISSGLQRVRIRLRRPDIPNRALATITGFVWPQLASVAVGRLTGESPQAFANLDNPASDNVSLDGSSLTYRDASLRFYRTVFKVGAANVAFQWPVPGVFLALEEPNDDVLFERPIEKGEVVQVRSSSRQRLKVYSSTDGILRLGDFSQNMMSALFGGVQLYLSNLVEFLSPEHQTLRLEISGEEHSVELVRLVTPHQVVEFNSTRSSDWYRLDFAVTGALTEISIDALDLLSGKREELRLEADAVSLSGNPFQRASILTHKQGRLTRAELSIPIADWQDGFWVLQLQARIDGRWGKLVNDRGDIYAGGLRIPSSANIRSYLESQPNQQAIHIFGRCVHTLLECYATESWRDLEWLEKEWQWLADDLRPIRLETHAKTLIALAFKRAPETAAESWVPVKAISAELTEIFGLPFTAYDDFDGAGTTTNAILGSGRIAPAIDEELFRTPFFSMFLMFGFENGRAVATGRAQHLRGFCREKFTQLAGMVGESERRRVSTSMEWAPTAGDLLGVRHYWWALNRLATSFSAAQRQNDFRKGNTLRLASRVAIMGPALIESQCDNRGVASLWSLGLMDPWTDDVDADQDLKNLKHIVEVISLIALAARLNARQSGLLAKVKHNLCHHTDLTDEQLTAVLGFIMYVGMDLFVFYLGLWEFVLVRDYDMEGD